MNEVPRPPAQVGPIHYQILCAAGLLLLVVAQLDQGLYLGNLLVARLGLFGILSKARIAPLLVLISFAAAQIGHHLLTYQSFEIEDRRPLLHLRDLLMALGLVTYVTAHYRLQSLWLNILPIDARQRQELPPRKPGRRRTSVAVQQKRSSRLLTPQEIARFVLAVPLCALAGQLLWLVIARPWQPWPLGLAVFPPRTHRLITFAWLLTIGILAVGTILTQWRRRRMDRAAAQMLLQDTLWHETRREQRRTFRWLAWRRLHERADQ